MFQVYFKKVSQSEFRKAESRHSGPQICKFMNDPGFSSLMSRIENSAWDCFVCVIQNILGNKKGDITLSTLKG